MHDDKTCSPSEERVLVICKTLASMIVYITLDATARVFVNGTGEEGSRSKGIDTCMRIMVRITSCNSRGRKLLALL